MLPGVNFMFVVIDYDCYEFVQQILAWSKYTMRNTKRR